MNRIPYLDQAKAWGMFLVYYGHFLEVLLRSGSTAAFPQWKWIYTFHMPFFFFLTGTFWNPQPLVSPVFNEKVRTRLVPVLFFGLLLVPAWLFVKTPLEVLAALGRYTSGKTDLNAITWFLVCLFVVELLAATLGKYLKLDAGRVVIYALFSLVLGLLLVWKERAVAHYTGVAEGFWYVNESFVALSFYLTGFAFRKFVLAPERLAGFIRAAILLVSGLLVFATYDLNTGPFPNRVLQGVVLAISSHGQPFYFALTALAGIAFLLALSWFTRRVFSWTEFIGRNSLIFLGLNGINLHFMDKWFFSRAGFLPGTGLQVAIFAGVYVLAVLLLFSLVALALRRWIPELVGYCWSETSLLPPMSEWGRRGVGLHLAHLARKVVLK
jgi:fucose 4-O-acetylase-like acetyltransferase